MKRYRLLIWPIWLLIGMIFLAACQSDALPGDDMGGGKQTVVHSDSCYINLRIVGNSQAITRATFSDQATAAENAVYDGILCIFEGIDETSATLKTAAYIDQLINNPGSKANSQELNVTQHLSIGKLPAVTDQHRYVLALLNTTSTGFKVNGNNLLFDGASQVGQTISQIQNLRIHSVGSTDKHVGLFMSNAPQDNDFGGISIMPEATDYLFDTEATAAAGSRLTINVERAAARVKVTNNVTEVTDIKLNKRSGDASTRHPSVHKMTWSLNHFNTKSYAIRTGSTAENNWATSINDLTSFTAKDFSLYPQQSHSMDVVYIGENTTATETEVIVEVQLKDNSNMLMHECFVFRPFNEFFVENTFTDIYTSAEQYIAYLRDELPPGNKSAYGLGSKNNSEIFKYATVKLNNDGSVVITLVNSDFTPEDQTGLNDLAAFLSSHTTGFRDGKMYYTYKIKHSDTQNAVVRNNAYDLTLQRISTIGRPTP